jgi:NhaP-type Na+/H+ or K+/H+ antiporter
VRPIACLTALWGSQLDRPEEKSFVAWFGVRGVGSLFYLAVAVEAGVLAGDERDLVVWTVIVAVLVSIVVHGITAGPSLRRLLRPRRAAPPPPSPRPR